jgi:hypothetical protein
MRPQNRHLKPFKRGAEWTGNRMGRTPKAADTAAGHVYFIQAGDGGPTKIGYTSRDPQKRFAAILSSSPVPLRLIGAAWSHAAAVREVELHAKFAKHRTSGEWFQLTDDMIRDAMAFAASPADAGEGRE